MFFFITRVFSSSSSSDDDRRRRNGRRNCLTLSHFLCGEEIINSKSVLSSDDDMTTCVLTLLYHVANLRSTGSLLYAAFLAAIQ
jgi:hypothetical protein